MRPVSAESPARKRQIVRLLDPANPEHWTYSISPVVAEAIDLSPSRTRSYMGQLAQSNELLVVEGWRYDGHHVYYHPDLGAEPEPDDLAYTTFI